MLKPIDPITMELIRCRLVASAQQMAAALWKSSYSTVIREVLDYSTALFDTKGRMVAQSAQLPFQMMTMSAPLQRLIENDYSWNPGDVVLLNDPYLCNAQHLPDLMTFRPVFLDDRVIAFTGAVAHMIDVGGGAPGSYLSTATEIYQEGLRIPPVKIVECGEPNQQLSEIIGLNVREPKKVLGDLAAMIACTRIGAERVGELVRDYGVERFMNAMDAILDGSELQIRKRLNALPQGTFRAVDHIDDDGLSEDPIRLELALKFTGDRVLADFSGSSPQVQGPVNATLEMTRTTVNYVLMAAIGEGIAKNDGFNRAVEIHAPARSVVNADAPAPVASRVTTCHRVVDLMMQALSQLIPDRVMAGYYGVSNICNLGGYDSQTGTAWVHFEIEVGGWGARPESDGLDGFSAHIHNLANTPIEVVESSLPLRVERYELIPDSGGPGRHRGGLGLRRDIRVLVDGASLNLLGDHTKFSPQGLLGGGNGAPGRYILNPDSDQKRVLPNKISNFRMNNGDVISMQTPGGGGYGRPEERDQVLMERDRHQGKVTE